MRNLIVVILLLLTISVAAAQDDTTGGSTVNIFYVTCESQGVVNFDGTMQAGYDIYYQLYAGTGASGQALSSMRRISVDGAYAVSEQLAYNSGQTVAAGSFGSARVLMARESDPLSTIYETTVDDVQDGCNSPRNATVSSTGANETVQTDNATTGTIRSPFGGFINTSQPPDPIVVIGVPSQPGRADQPGVIFAECDQYPEANPGLLYDNDNIVIYWSWFARSPEQVQDHIDNAQYNVTFMTEPLVPVIVSPIQNIGGNYWVFYTAQVGNLSPGKYGVNFKLRWTQAIDDGFEKFGPGTLNDRFESTCTFEIKQNPFGAAVDYNGMYSLNR